MPHYYDMDRVGQQLFRIKPDDFGIPIRDSEMYIGLAVRDYFMVLDQEQRIMVLKNLVVPKKVNVLIDAVHEIADVKLAEADINRDFLGMITVYAVQMALQALENEQTEITDSCNPSVDKGLAMRLRGMSAQVIRAAYDSFEAEKMSQEMEAFLREVYTVIIKG